jgi:hypothetical protein
MDRTEGNQVSVYDSSTDTITMSRSMASSVKRAKTTMKLEAPCETWVKKAFKKIDPSFLKVYIDGKPHFKIFSVQYMGETQRVSQRIISDDTLRVARACGLRLTKDEEWIIQKDEDGLNHSLTRFLDRPVRMNRVY